MKNVYLFLAFLVLANCQSSQPTPTPTPAPAPASSADVFPTKHAVPLPAVDARSPEQIASAACTAADGSWRCKSAKPPVPKAASAGGTRPATIPSSWTIANWFVDPANVTTCASNNNTCTSATCGGTSVGPCLSYAEISARWGSISPRLRQTTTLKWLSSQSGDSDPVYFNPYLETTAFATIQGSLTATVTSTLANTTAKNRNTPQLLQENLTAGGAVGQLVINTTHPARAWAWKSLGANIFAMTQPLTAATPGTFISPTEVDTWADGDSYTANAVTKIDLVQFLPVVSDLNGATGNNYGTVYNAYVLDPQGSGSELLVNRNVDFIESGTQRVILSTDSVGSYAPGLLMNTLAEVGMISGTSVGWGGNTAFPVVYGGALGVPSTVGGVNLTNLAGIFVGSDTIISTTFTTVPPSVQTAAMGLVYIDTNTVLTVSIGADNTRSVGTAGNIVWGPGKINVIRQGRMVYPSGAGAAAATFKLTGGLQLNGVTTNSCSLVTSTGIWTCTNAVSAAQLDTVGGASLGGLSIEPGGASISNGGL